MQSGNLNCAASAHVYLALLKRLALSYILVFRCAGALGPGRTRQAADVSMSDTLESICMKGPCHCCS